LLGGKIDVAKVIIENIGTPVLIQDVVEGQKKQEQMDYNRFLKELADSQRGSIVQLTQGPDPLVDFRYRNVIPHSSYQHFFTRYPEEDLIQGAEKLYSGNGSSSDHPRLHQLVMDSLGHHPELISLYSKS
jgi:hypothetical protein